MLNQPWDVVFLGGFAIYVGMRHVFAKRTMGEEKLERRVDGMEKALLSVVVLGSLLLPVLYLFTPVLSSANYESPAYAPWVGLVFMVGALWLFWRSHADLGLNWSISLEVRKDHQLVQNGVYRRIRHPMYSSIFLWSLAQGLMLENWIAGWSALVTFAPLYLVRVPREELMMGEVFGEAYREYTQRTGRLLPRFSRRG